MEKVTYTHYVLSEDGKRWVNGGRKPATLLKWFPMEGDLFGLMEHDGIPIVRCSTEITFDYLKKGDRVKLLKNFSPYYPKPDIGSEGTVTRVKRNERGDVYYVSVKFENIQPPLYINQTIVDIREIEKI